MTNLRAERLIEDYGSNTWLIRRLTDGLTHEESLLQPPYRANCLNWLIGHIACGRNTALTLLGFQSLWPDEMAARYETGSAPIRSGEEALPLGDLLSDLDEAGSRVAAGLADIQDEALDRLAQTDRGLKPVYEHLAGLRWHETYHVGQLELLRAMALAERKT